MRSLLVIASHHMIGKKGLAAARRSQYKLIAIGADSHLNRLITDINMNWFSCQPVSQPDTAGTQRRFISRFHIQEAYRLFSKGVEGVIHGKVRSISRHSSPIDLRSSDSFLLGSRIHLRKS
ncbi:hypothetical protein D3C80_1101250 [compost metagenome]